MQRTIQLDPWKLFELLNYLIIIIKLFELLLTIEIERQTLQFLDKYFAQKDTTIILFIVVIIKILCIMLISQLIKGSKEKFFY